MSPALEDAIKQMRQMPVMSPTVRQLVGRLSDEAVAVDELASGIGQDPILAGRVLRLANSPFYGVSRQIASLREAAIILGMHNIRTLVVAGGVLEAFSRDDAACLETSLRVAGGARGLARCLQLDHEMAFTAGLMHNLGLLVLQHQQPARYLQQVKIRLAAGESDRLSLEREAFDFDHCELGAEIARSWNFPEPIQAAIRYQNAPPVEPRQPVTEVIHVCAHLDEEIAGTDAGAGQPAVGGFAFPLGTWQDCLVVAREEARQALQCLGTLGGAAA